MDPLTTLRNEHGLMRQYLDNLGIAVEQMEDGKRPPRAFFELAVRFAKDFADKFHHHKEEHLMFAQVAMKHDGEIDGQIEALRHQHETGRDYMTEINGAMVGYEDDNPVTVGRVLECTAAYVSMLRSHIHREDHVVYPMAAKLLSEDDIAQLQVDFDLAREKAGGEMFERYHAMVIEMGSMLAHR